MADKTMTREILLKERQLLDHELADLRKGQPALGERREGSPFGKREEEAAEAADLERRMALEQKLGALILDTDRALEKLDNGTYGTCDVCRQPISPERLEALPAAHLCLKCKSAQDKSRVRR